MKRIAQLRKEKGLNQVGLALKLNVSQKMISAYESGVHQPSIETLSGMADLFGVSIDYLVGRSDIKLPAEQFSKDGLSADEVELLDLYKAMPRETQKRAIGVLFALREYDKGK